MRVPRYIQDFMGKDFRIVEGVNVHFNLADFEDSNFNCQLEDKKGCYIISSPNKKFEYAKGNSPVIYIGMSDHLYRRLHDEHYGKYLKVLINDKDFGLKTNRIHQLPDRYQYMYWWGAVVDVFYCKGNQSEKEFESSLIANFYYKYRCMPVGNGARSFSQK